MSEPTPEQQNAAVVQVRHLTADLDDANQVLTDDQLKVYLALNDWNVRRGAADALEAIASSETLVGKVIRTQDLQTDGPKVADSLRRHAATLRAQADAADEADADIFDVSYPPSGRRPRPELTEHEVWGL